MTEAVTVAVCSMIEADQVARMRAVDPRIEVVDEPDLLPVPQYPADHNGRRRELTDAQRPGGTPCWRRRTSPSTSTGCPRRS